MDRDGFRMNRYIYIYTHNIVYIGLKKICPSLLGQNSFLVLTTFSIPARHGSQPPLLLLLYDRVEWIPEVWNVDGVSGSNVGKLRKSMGIFAKESSEV